MAVEIAPAAVGALLTAALVAITWRYARSTEEIARETSRAAAAARTTAQVNLLQSLLAVQPMLQVSDLQVEYWHGETAAGRTTMIPFRLEWTVTNSGSGTAFHLDASARIGDVEVPVAQSVNRPTQLTVGQTARIAHQSDRTSWPDLAQDSGGPARSGELLVVCSDAYGASLKLSALFSFDDKSSSLVSVERSYEGGRELREMLRRLLETLRSDP